MLPLSTFQSYSYFSIFVSFRVSKVSFTCWLLPDILSTHIDSHKTDKRTRGEQYLGTMSSVPAVERQQAEARAAVIASLNSVGSSYTADLQARAADLHANAAVLTKQERELNKQTDALAKQTVQWKKLADTTTKQLNEFGDVQNWAEMIERDLLVVEETMRLVEGREPSDNISGTG